MFFIAFLATSCNTSPDRITMPDANENEDEEEEGDEGRDSGGRYLKWVLKSSGDSVSSVELQVVDADKELSPHLTGGFMAIASKGENPLSAYPFKFPEEMISEGRDEEGVPFTRREALTGDRIATVWIKLENPIDKLSIMDAQGNNVLEVTTLTTGESLSGIDPKPPKDNRTQTRMQTRRAISSGIPQLEVITSMQEFQQLACATQVSGVQIVWDPQSVEFEAAWGLEGYDLNYIKNLLQKAAPATLSSVSHIALVSYKESYSTPNFTVWGNTCGSVVTFNVQKIGEAGFRGTVVHELAHTYTYLLDMPDSGAQGLNWPSNIRDLARQTVAQKLIGYDFSRVWLSIQDNALQNGLTINYVGYDAYKNTLQYDEMWKSRTSDFGFAAPYGATSHWEDIATYVESVQLYPQGNAHCSALQATQGGEFPISLAIPYAKLVLLKNAGFIGENKATDCYGNVGIRGGAGIHFVTDNVNSPSFSFTTDLRTGFETTDGNDFFDVIGSGPNDYKILIQIQVPGRQPPLGLYRLDEIGLAYMLSGANGTLNGVYLANYGDNMRARTSADGLVLISSATADPPKAEGVIFFLSLRNAWGAITDFYPITTFNVGQ